MGPKKQIKKQIVEQPPKQVQPEIPAHELSGYGRFDYPGGASYQGQWRLFTGVKLKHGRGTLTVSSNSLGKEGYEGEWEQDQMKGQGNYYYPDGSVYRGEWKANRHHGKGVYEFSNGTVYEGQWQNNVLHGSGFFIDGNGRKWEGQFRGGVFESKRQAELVKERTIQLKKQEIVKEVGATLQALLQALAKSDKKTLKDNLQPFFPLNDNVKQFVKQPYAKFDERPPQKWTDLLNCAKSGEFKVLTNNQEASLIAADRILAKQLQGNGQFVQLVGVREDKTAKLGLVGIEGKRWILVAASEEQKKK